MGSISMDIVSNCRHWGLRDCRNDHEKAISAYRPMFYEPDPVYEGMLASIGRNGILPLWPSASGCRLWSGGDCGGDPLTPDFDHLFS
jgi:hypothetical protein